jgi:hypothetical protein
MSLGTLTVSTPTYVSGLSGYTMNFETVKFDPDGSTLDQLIEIQEELSDVGIDGKRWRRVNKQFRPFVMQTTFNAANTYSAARTEQQTYLLAIGQIGDLTASLSGTTYRWKNVKVLDCVPKVFRGSMVGNGLSSSTAVVIAQWTMQLSKQAGNA